MSGYEKSPDYGGTPPTHQQWVKAVPVLLAIIGAFVLLAVARPG